MKKKVIILLAGIAILSGGIFVYQYFNVQRTGTKQVDPSWTKSDTSADNEPQVFESDRGTGEFLSNTAIRSKNNTYINSSGKEVDSPNSDSAGATAQCIDGLYSHSQNPSGTCSSHGGVRPFCSTVKLQYESKIDAENRRYTFELGNFKEQMNNAGLFDSGHYHAGIDSIEREHTANLLDINNWYTSQLCWSILTRAREFIGLA